MEEEVEREEREVALQGRRPRHLPADNSTIVGNDSIQSNLKSSTEEEEEEEEGLVVSSEISSEEEDKGEDGEFRGERGNGKGKLGKRTSVGEDNGAEHTNWFSGLNHEIVDPAVSVRRPNDEELEVAAKRFDDQTAPNTEIIHEYEARLGDQYTSFHPLDEETTGTAADANLIQEIEPELIELDVERVLEKQNSHDLFCPNCNSCITRRVILRKRKRTAQNIVYNIVKRDKVVHEFGPNIADDQGGITVDAGPTITANVPVQDGEPGVFRCLSCFSFFIPSGDGFKLFRIFRVRKETENVQGTEQIPVANVNQSSSFTSIKEEIVTEQGVLPVKVPEDPTMGTEVALLKPPKDGKGTLPAVNEDLVVQEEQVNKTDLQVMHAEGHVAAGVHPVEVSQDNSIKDDALKPPIPDVILPPKPPKEEANVTEDIDTKPPEISAGGNVIYNVEQNITTADTVVVIPQVDTQVAQQRAPERDEVQEWDILKAIVYGGLMESITSVGVVSSAAGADAKTLNIFILGLANLFGGLFLIFHGLRELKNEQQNGQVDRYEESLGRRGRFSLHATVAVISYLLFGLVPPVTYGFSFYKSDNRDYKIAAVAAASFVCIFLLSIAKAHVQKPPKSYIKTVLHYLSIWITVTGVSYLVGELIQYIIEKLGLFESSTVTLVPLLEAGSMNRGWASF